MSHEFDLIIVGGGLVGLAITRGLAGTGLAVGLVDRETGVRFAEDGWDSRIYAISPASEAFLRQLQAWPERPDRMAAVLRMSISGDRPGSHLEFDAYAARVPRLATIAESGLLVNGLRDALDRGGNVTWFSGRRCSAVHWHETSAALTLDTGEVLRARLLVGADGGESWLRGQAGIDVVQTPYEHTAVVANFETARDHQSTAFQWFREDGVLALLPLPGSRVSIVWSARDDVAQRLRALPSEALADEVAQASGHVLGELQLVTPPACFPLRCMRVQHLIAPRLALVGDAAHNLHPLAGQGVNLGFADARHLIEVLSQRGPETDVGAHALLRRYERSRREDIAAMTAVTHGLQRLFNAPGTLLASLRNLGLNLTDRLPPLKSLLVRQATGSPIYHD
jgi:ubiquinone biosynthesis UbiH/UbiF/VisC/COQ6 family hydroxylase